MARLAITLGRQHEEGFRLLRSRSSLYDRALTSLLYTHHEHCLSASLYVCVHVLKGAHAGDEGRSPHAADAEPCDDRHQGEGQDVVSRRRDPAASQVIATD